MAVAQDPASSLQNYAHPESLVTAQWLSAHLGTPGLRVVESDEDALLYDIGHIPGAVRIDWRRDLNNPITRDYINGEEFAALMDAKGISRSDTVVIYGDKSNWWAAFTFWVFKLFGHEDVRLLDGGRDAWMSEERDTSYMVPELVTSGYPVVERDDHTNRIFVNEIRSAQSPLTLIDVRTEEEYAGIDNPDSSFMSALRRGHIPGAHNVLWSTATMPNSRFRTREELNEAYGSFASDQATAIYCQVGERAAHTWFVLKYLLGYENVRNYDGSWAEWGNMVQMPIAIGEEPGTPLQ